MIFFISFFTTVFIYVEIENYILNKRKEQMVSQQETIKRDFIKESEIKPEIFPSGSSTPNISPVVDYDYMIEKREKKYNNKMNDIVREINNIEEQIKDVKKKKADEEIIKQQKIEEELKKKEIIKEKVVGDYVITEDSYIEVEIRFPNYQPNEIEEVILNDIESFEIIRRIETKDQKER